MKPIYLISLLVLIVIPVIFIAMRPGDFSPNLSPSSAPTTVPDVEEPAEAPENTVMLDNLSAGDVVSSPLTITGTVPPGWMFEASFPISIMDQNGEIISQGYGEPIPPDEWMSGEPVRFTATLTFETDTEAGIIRFEKDNPSGLPENAESFDVAVNFR